MEIVAAFGGAAGCSEAGWDLLQPARATSAATNRNPKPLKHRGTEEAEEFLSFLMSSIFTILAK
jgi:hypothetical protein